jgi:hypothetical protein
VVSSIGGPFACPGFWVGSLLHEPAVKLTRGVVIFRLDPVGAYIAVQMSWHRCIYVMARLVRAI